LNTEQLEKMKTGKGFIAALDQSGGSTPKALKLYGIEESAYAGEEEMFDLVHEMRTRIIKSPSLNAERTLGAILFDMTMERNIDGKGTAEYLWENKKIVPFLKIDNGLAAEENGVQVMKSIPELDDRLARANGHKVFGTKMRSVIKLLTVKEFNKLLINNSKLVKKYWQQDLVQLLSQKLISILTKKNKLKEFLN